MPTANTIDKTTKVNLGILGTLLVSAVGGAAYLTTLNSNVVAVVEGQDELKHAIDRNTEQLMNDGKALAVLDTLVKTIDRRVGELERTAK